MTIQELRARLKHCAGLLYGVSSDLNVDLGQIAELERRNGELENEINELRIGKGYKPKRRIKLSDEERKQRQREAMRRYQAKKKAERQDQSKEENHDFKD